MKTLALLIVALLACSCAAGGSPCREACLDTDPELWASATCSEDQRTDIGDVEVMAGEPVSCEAWLAELVEQPPNVGDMVVFKSLDGQCRPPNAFSVHTDPDIDGGESLCEYMVARRDAGTDCHIDAWFPEAVLSIEEPDGRTCAFEARTKPVAG